MIRSYYAIACAIFGVVLTLAVQRGVDIYVFFVVFCAIPWDKVAEVAGTVAEEHYARRDQRGRV